MVNLRLAMPINGADFDTDCTEYGRSNTEVSLKPETAFEYITVLADFNGTDGDTSYTEKGIYNFPFVFGGNARLSSTQKKFGDTSVYFDGTSGSYIYADTGNFNPIIGTQDFSIDFWLFLNANQNAILFDYRPQSAGVYPTLYVLNSSGNKIVYFTNGANKITGTTTLSNSTWYHIALCRVSGTTTLYLDGASEGTWADSSDYKVTTDRPLIGADGQTLNNNRANCYIDEVRVQIGAARWSTTFTPPTAPTTPYPTETTVNPLQVDSGSNATTWDMSTFLTLVNPNGESGTVKFKYATDDTGNTIPDYADDDTAYSSTWLTLAQLQAVSDPTAGCFRIVMQITGNGAQDGTVTDSSIVATITTTGGGSQLISFGNMG